MQQSEGKTEAEVTPQAQRTKRKQSETSSDSKYTGTLTNIKAEKMQQEEYRNLDKRRRNTIEQASVSVEGDGIKLE